MPRILLLSDTHSYLDESLEEYIRKADEVWHAGDIGHIQVCDRILSWNDKLKAVYGNIDGHEIRSEYPEHLILSYGSHKVLMIHIAGALGKYNSTTRNLIQEHQPTLLVCGHSHILKVKKDVQFELLYMNPGACGHHGFHHMRTVLQFELQPDAMRNLEVIELGKRGRK